MAFEWRFRSLEITITTTITNRKRSILKEERTFERIGNKTLKIRRIKTLIWSMVLYGAETWTMRKEDPL